MNMTRADQFTFVNELVNRVQSELLLNIERIPEEWDGHELRQWIADKFQESAYTLQRDKPRYRAYRNEVLVRNL